MKSSRCCREIDCGQIREFKFYLIGSHFEEEVDEDAPRIEPALLCQNLLSFRRSRPKRLKHIFQVGELAKLRGLRKVSRIYSS